MASIVGDSPWGVWLGRGTAGPFGLRFAGCIFLLPKDRIWTGNQEGPSPTLLPVKDQVPCADSSVKLSDGVKPVEDTQVWTYSG